jgi:hypothetical protein
VVAARDHTFATFPSVTDDDVAAILKFILEGVIFICEYGGVNMSVSFRFHFGFVTVSKRLQQQITFSGLFKDL